MNDSRPASSYTRRSLAQMYFPDSAPRQAVRRLTEWIKRCRPLHERLTEDGRQFDRRRNLTIREVRLIYEYLGEP
ncbi:MAG: DUF4248 domain-containing protein [Paraprevotella sp.]|nr:DUF4248 domain-containing protein [Paraprevotella sp.]